MDGPLPLLLRFQSYRLLGRKWFKPGKGLILTQIDTNFITDAHKKPKASALGFGFSCSLGSVPDFGQFLTFVGLPPGHQFLHPLPGINPFKQDLVYFLCDGHLHPQLLR